jgi:hypothetical protein
MNAPSTAIISSHSVIAGGGPALATPRLAAPLNPVVIALAHCCLLEFEWDVVPRGTP